MNFNHFRYLAGASTVLAMGVAAPQVHAIDEGIYEISAKHSGKCLDVAEVSKSDGALLQQWSCSGGDNQRWRVTNVGAGYRLQAVHSSKCLDVKDWSTSNGGVLQQWSCGSGENQQWQIEAQADGSYRLRSNYSNRVADVAGAMMENGARVQQWSWTGGSNQRWQFKKLGNTTDNSTTPLVWGENFESIAPGTHWFGENLLEVRSGCGVGGGRCVRASYVPSSEGSQRIVFRKSLPASQEYTLNYDVMFENDFEFVNGGKLLGLGPKNETAGCAPQTADGWSARVMWRTGGVPVIYSYDQNRANRCGEDYYSSFVFQKGQYYAVSLHVKVNNPASSWNGLIELYANGQKIAQQTNVQLRATGGTDTEINNFLFDTFHGGSSSWWSPSKTVHSRFDNIGVYKGLRVRKQPGQ